MFNDLDTALENVISDLAAPAALRAADVSFLSLDQMTQVQTAVLNLFLVSAEVNGDLRNRLEIIDSSGTSYISRRPPMPVDCTYMVTAWAPSNNTAPDRVRVEHELLSLAAAWLDRFQVIPNSYLGGALKDPVFLPELRVALASDKMRLAEFWSALGIRPRTYFTVVATIPLDLRESLSGPVVTTFIQRYALVGTNTVEERIEIGGWVLDATDDTPIPGAAVQRLDAGGSVLEQSTSDSQGRYTFTGLRAGPHQLRASATGFTPLSRAINLPADPPAQYVFKLS